MTTNSRPPKTLISEWGQYESVPVIVIEMIPRIDAIGFSLFCYLLWRTNVDQGGTAWPGYRRMNTDLGWGNTRIKRAIRLLKDAGLLATRKRFGGTTIYTLTRPESAPNSQSSHDGRNEESDASAAPRMGAQSSHNGSESTLIESTLTKDDAVEHQHDSKQERLILAGVWEEEAAKISPNFSKEEVTAAIKACELKGPDNPGAYLLGILERWRKFPEERAREVERLSKGPYDQAGFWDA